MNILDLIRNAKDGSYVDFRTADGQIDSVPIENLRALLGIGCKPEGIEREVQEVIGYSNIRTLVEETEGYLDRICGNQ